MCRRSINSNCCAPIPSLVNTAPSGEIQHACVRTLARTFGFLTAPAMAVNPQHPIQPQRKSAIRITKTDTKRPASANDLSEVTLRLGVPARIEDSPHSPLRTLVVPTRQEELERSEWRLRQGYT